MLAKQARFRFWPVIIFLVLVVLTSGAARAGKPCDTKPIVKAPDAEMIKKGKMVFVKATCWGCHPHGDNTLYQDKPLKGARFARLFADDQAIRDFVRKGSARRGMPAFSKERLSDSDLDAIIVFIRSLTPRQ